MVFRTALLLTKELTVEQTISSMAYANGIHWVGLSVIVMQWPFEDSISYSAS